MGKSYKIILGILLVLLAALVFLEANQRDPINWFPSYTKTDKIPFGTYVFYENLKEHFQVNDVNVPPFEFLSDSTHTGTYFFLNQSVGLDEIEMERLLNWVKKGNTAVISATNISYPLLDTLKLTFTEKIRTNGLTNIAEYNFSNPKLKADKNYSFNRDKTLFYFDSLNGKKQKVLGFAKLQEDEPYDSLPNFVENKFGKGKFLLQTSPETFSNFFLLRENNVEYAEKFLAYLNSDQTLYWDNHYKNGKTFYTSPLYILLGNPYLKWAYYFVLIAAILFVFFEGKRKQKSIKVIEPLRNQTYEYTQTISGMYLDRKDYKSIAYKLIDQFLNFLRKELKVDVQKQENYSELLEIQTDNTSEEIKILLSKIQELQRKNSISKKEVEELNRLIIQFKKNI